MQLGMDTNKWVNFPKLELHCHLDGSLSREFVESRLARGIALSELQVNKECRDLSEYLEKFSLPLTCLQDEEGMRKAGYDFIKNVSGENIRYIEVRFAPNLSSHDTFTCSRVIQALLEGLESGKKDFGTEYNVIVCAMRGHTQEQNLMMLKSAREFLGEGVCAADLAGNEAAYPMSEFMKLFEEVKKMSMPFTIHAGECGSEKNVEDAVKVGALRIGHGIAMRGHRDIEELCCKKRIGIEMCPLSNLQTKAVGDISEYPLKEFIDAGLKVTINTDNRTVSGSTVSDELKFIQETYGIHDEEIYQIMENAVEVSFADDSVKDRLLRQIQNAKGEK